MQRGRKLWGLIQNSDFAKSSVQFSGLNRQVSDPAKVILPRRKQTLVTDLGQFRFQGF
jgi:hypothetical protein